VIPGITSAIAVPASAGIPVTKRGVAESFWVVTGTTSSGELSKDLALAAQSTATVVILMGTRKLKDVIQVYHEVGKADLPIAIIQSGTTREEKITAGFVHDIEAKAFENGVDAPAIIIIGEVVRESQKLAEIYLEVLVISKQSQ
jgi:uroporphyrin-III C-methyltransferase